MGKQNKLTLGIVIFGIALLSSYSALKWHITHKNARLTLMLMRDSNDLSTYIPPQGFVPDKETAISIAVAIWKPLFGEDTIKRQAPYQATLVDGIWVIVGTSPGRRIHSGGYAHAFIKKDTGEVVSVYHEL